MNLTLFSRDFCHSDLSYQDNLKIKPLLESFCDGISDKLILELMSFYGTASEIQKRQEFFKEICENEKARELLKKIRVFYRPLESAVAFYRKQPGFPERYIWGVNLLECYVSFAEKVVAEKESLDVELSSEIFTGLYKSIFEATKSPWFSELKKRLSETEAIFGKIRNVNIVTNYRNALMSSYELNFTGKESFKDTMGKMLEGLGLEIDDSRRYSSDDVDLYERYSRYIVDKAPELSSFLGKINNEFAQLIYMVENSSIKDVCIAIACCEFYDFLKGKGVNLCYPSVSSENALYIKDAVDISLLLQKDDIVPNSINLSGDEKVVFISGANGGGKTSYVRAVGICNILFSCGLFVPAASAELGIWDNIFTMFPHKEQLSERGRFVTEKHFFETVMDKTTKDSLVLANELFSSTNEATALEQFKVLIKDIEKKGGRVFFVTHFTQVVRSFQDAGYPAFSCKMENDAVTFKVERSGGHSSSVIKILEKYGLTKLKLKERLK